MQRRMRSLCSVLAGAAALTLTFLPGTARAETLVRTLVDGQEIQYEDVQPFIDDSRTLVPVRGFLEALGATVAWDPESRTAIALMNTIEVRATIGEMTAYVNGEPVSLDVPAQIVADRTVIPLRFFAENLGLIVGWDGENNTVLISSRRTATVSRDGSSVSRRDDPTPDPSPEPTAAESAAAMTQRAEQLVGLPYAWGGTSPETGFDCSGFIYYLTGQFGLGMPRTSFDMYEVGTPVSMADLRVGDLVFFTTYAPGASHVGVYDGEGSFIHAQSEWAGVQRTPLDKPWWAERYIGARRIFE